MIATDAYADLTTRFPALGGLDAKLTAMAREELQPDEEVERVDSVTVWGRPGVVWLGASRVFVVGSMKMFFFFTFPTQSELRVDQLRTLVEAGDAKTLHLKSTASEGDDDDYEEIALVFDSPADRLAFVQALITRRPDLNS